MPERGTPDAVATGAERAFAHLFRSLSQWVGTVGCNALFARALALSTPQHPVLRGVRFQLQNEVPQLECLAENAREYGSQATTEGATTVLASIITMLGGLIGEDITMRILEESPRASETPSAPSVAAPTSKRTTTSEGEMAS